MDSHSGEEGGLLLGTCHGIKKKSILILYYAKSPLLPAHLETGQKDSAAPASISLMESGDRYSPNQSHCFPRQ